MSRSVCARTVSRLGFLSRHWRIAYRQAQTNQTIRLTVVQCKAMTRLTDLIRFYVERKNGWDTIYLLGAKHHETCTGRQTQPVVLWTGRTNEQFFSKHIKVDGRILMDSYLFPCNDYRMVRNRLSASRRLMPGCKFILPVARRADLLRHLDSFEVQYNPWLS